MPTDTTPLATAALATAVSTGQQQPALRHSTPTETQQTQVTRTRDLDADLVEVAVMVAVGGQQGVGSLRSDPGMPTTLADDRRWISADATARSKRRRPRRAERPDRL